MLRIDPEKIEQQLATMIEDLLPHCDGSDPGAVVARMQMQVIPALIRWKTGEANRGTDHNGVLNAFVAMVSSQLVSLTVEVIGSTEISGEHFTTANTVLMAIGEEIGSILSGEREMQAYNVPAERSH